MKRARRPSPSGRSVNSSIQLALTRTSGLSGVPGRQDTDQYKRSVVRGIGDAGGAVEAEDVEDVLRLRAAEQLG